MSNQGLTYKDYADIAQAIATVLAIIVGGIWSYKGFVQKRLKYPCATIEHAISHRRMGNRQLLLSVAVTITNDGNVRLPLAKGATYVRCLVPAPLHLLAQKHSQPATAEQTGWPLIAYQAEETGNLNCAGLLKRALDALLGKASCAVELEPHGREQFFYNFIVEDSVRSIAVETFFSNPRRQHRVGWRTTTLYDLRRPATRRATRQTSLQALVVKGAQP